MKKAPPRSQPKAFHTIPQVADRYQVSTRTVRRWIKEGLLNAHRFGAQWRVSEAALEAFELRHRLEP